MFDQTLISQVGPAHRDLRNRFGERTFRSSAPRGPEYKTSYFVSSIPFDTNELMCGINDPNDDRSVESLASFIPTSSSTMWTQCVFFSKKSTDVNPSTFFYSQRPPRSGKTVATRTPPTSRRLTRFEISSRASLWQIGEGGNRGNYFLREEIISNYSSP